MICLSWTFYSDFLYGLCVLGEWKSQVESPSAFSYSDPQRGRDIYPSPKYNSASKVNSLCFTGNNSLAAVSGNSMFWSNRVDGVTESFSPVTNKDCGERRQGTGNGCRLFGIQLLENSNVEESSPVVMVSGKLGDIRPISSFDAESDQHSEPSNVNRSDLPSGSCDAEKSCLRSPQESQSRQIRSCTKVVHVFLSLNLIIFSNLLLDLVQFLVQYSMGLSILMSTFKCLFFFFLKKKVRIRSVLSLFESYYIQFFCRGPSF